MNSCDWLAHHGVKGQKWGVRRYQDKDGHHTPEGRERDRARKRIASRSRTKPMVDDIMRTMTKKERDFIGLDKPRYKGDNDPGYLDLEGGESVIKRILKKDGDVPVSVLDIFDNGTGTASIAVGTRNDEKYRHKGYMAKSVQEGKKWFDSNSERLGLKELYWWADSKNVKSNNLAKKSGFEYSKSEDYNGSTWNQYVYKKG